MAWKYVQRNDETGAYRTTSSGGGGSSNLADLEDVDLNNLEDGQIIKWDATNEKFVNANESGGSSSHTYSTTPQPVGTYIDGKTVYEKTYDATISDGFHVFDNDISVDTLVYAIGSVYDNDGLSYNFPYYNGSNQMARIIRDHSTIWTTNRGLVMHSAGFVRAKLVVRYTEYSSS